VTHALCDLRRAQPWRMASGGRMRNYISRIGKAP
jgi:hypothetical protein